MLPLKLQVDIGAQLKVSYEEEAYRKFKCYHCNYKLTLAPNLNCHMKNKHIELEFAEISKNM